MRILIADDHAIVRRGLKQLLLEHYPSAQIGEASNVETIISLIENDPWDVVICDLSMPDRSGLAALNQIKQISAHLPVLIMSIYPEDQYAVRVLKAGASGYLGKDTIHDDIFNAIETVISGRKFITPGVAERLAFLYDRESSMPPHETLSRREFDVFKQLASGRSLTEIGEQLSLSTTTISTYRSRIMDKMNMRSNADLTRYALEKGLI